jgi:hypothetical protein
METPIPGLRGSLTHRISAELYRRHHDDGNGWCDTCGGRTPCPVRRYAASVIIAAGEDPGTYDIPQQGGAAPKNASIRGTEEPSSPPPAASALALRNYIGYHLGGRNRPVDCDGFAYDRDSR